ncbi:MAG: EamA family transporter [Thermodesulfobacteriota bacterium]
MGLSAVFALGSMFCAGLNDLVFKRYVTRERSKGAYIALIGAIWALFFYATGSISGGMRFDHDSVFYGLISGAILIIANILLLEGFHGVDASVGSTIYRLNFVVVVFLAPFFLAEQLTLRKLGGVAFAIASVFLMSWSGDSRSGPWGRTVPLFFLLVIMAGILRGLMGFFYKVGTMHGVDVNAFLFINALFWVVGGPIYSLIFEEGLRINRSVITYGIISGLLVVGIASFLFLSVKAGEAIIAVPIAQLSFTVTAVLSVWLLKEAVTRQKVLGIFCAVMTVLILSL